MSKSERIDTFSEQIASAMSELRSIMSSGKSPTGDGKLTVQTIKVAGPLKSKEQRAGNFEPPMNSDEHRSFKQLKITKKRDSRSS